MNVPGVEVDCCAELPDIVPYDAKQAYDVRRVIATFVDEDSFFEVQRNFAKKSRSGFLRAFRAKQWVSSPTRATISLAL